MDSGRQWLDAAPVGSELNLATMRMELVSFAEVLLNPVAQVKFVHTVSAGYVTGAVFVLAISSWYLLKGREVAFARRSFAIASAFGLASALSVIVLGDESGYELGDVQKVKLAAIEAEWQTHPAPAAFTLFGLPNEAQQHTDFAIRIPGVMGLIATRSLDTEVMGIRELKEEHRERIVNGQEAYALMQRLRSGEAREGDQARFEEVRSDLGYGLLLSAYSDDVANATAAEINQTVEASIPKVWPLFWSFRAMVAAGFSMLLLFALAFWHSVRRQPEKSPWLLRFALFSLPLPWIACEAGWFVAEYGRQPWAIGEILPVHLAISSLTAEQVLTTLIAIGVLYTTFVIIEMWLMQHLPARGHPAAVTWMMMPMLTIHPRPGGMMMDYETLRFVWWVLIGVLLIGFAVTDGFDMGVASLLKIVGRGDEERRVMINSMAPHWDGNQVWLVTAGGALFAAWPPVYATAFNGFYFALMLTLFALFCVL
ncbi:hypothetical protein HORIV_56750 [Vreelandella olivaria]|uniref:Uncharacterized protein n=1 Tax=Vreelandella olivaria TaxID=390919 RepID=A0ABN5X1Y8_9GAMM|nr:hypothetical protein HORIV_56750 [Halomonas olivaria]